MKHSEFFAALKNGELARCYLFEGEEEYTKRSALQQIRKQVAGGDFAAMNDTRLSDPAPDALIAAADSHGSSNYAKRLRNVIFLRAQRTKDYRTGGTG